MLNQRTVQLTEALKDGSIVGDVPFQLCGYLLNLPSISAHLERRQHQDRLDSQAGRPLIA